MAHHKSALKAHRKSLFRRSLRISRMSRVKTFIKNAESQILSSSDFDSAAAAVRNAESQIMRAVSKKMLSKNTGGRKVSKLVHKLKSKFNTYAA